MKKSLILVGLLSIGYAHAQQGNVGVNTNAPKATLEVQPTATNLAGTSNEGIIAPKLTKTRIADIAVPVEGTLVCYIGVGTSTPIARLDIAERVFIDSWNIANGVAIRAFKTPWARGYNFISEDKSFFLGGLQAYSSNGDEINYFSIGSDHINKTIVKFYPDTFNTHFRGSIGVGIEAPTEKLEVAGAIKVANSTDNTCDTTKAGTIRFDATAKKFQGCTGDNWVDLHN